MRGGFSDAVQGYIIDSYYSLDANPNRLAATFSNILTGGAKSAFRGLSPGLFNNRLGK
jgi:hypothetical protein